MHRSHFVSAWLRLLFTGIIALLIVAPLLVSRAAPSQSVVELAQGQNYELHVAAGSPLVWRNTTASPHRLRASDGSWETPLIQSGESFTQTLTAIGSSSFLCDFDPDMRGSVFVQGESTIFVPLVASRLIERWSEPATWGGRLPQANDTVTIPAGKVVLLDVSPPALRSLFIEGELIFDQRDLELTAGWIMLHGNGRLRIGSPSAPFQHRATITLNAPDMDEDVMGMGTRGILVMGGSFEAYGATPGRVWTRLGDHAAASTDRLTLSETVDWQAGDQIVIAPTDFYGFGETERLVAQTVADNQITLAAPLQRARWGRLQYVAADGMTLTPTMEVTPLVLDERAEVGVLSRRIVIQGADDQLWRDHRFGAHVMVMDSGVLRLDGVELRRMGQGGRFGRYPIHFHLLSYRPDGSLIGDATAQMIANSSVWNSANRCIVIHGTNGVTVRNNICYDIAGHAVFLEDAVERRNVIEGNLVLKVRQPPQPLLPSDQRAFRRGPSGFWLTNPDNIVRGNVAADVDGNGFWLAFPQRALGPNRNVPIRPFNLPLGVFSHNVAHSNNRPGINIDFAPHDDEGNTSELKYAPTVDGSPDRYNNRVRFTLSDITVYKNNDNGLWNRVTLPDYVRFVSADNLGMFFAGAGDNGKIFDSLIVGVSLNNATPPPIHLVGQPNTAVASYHSTFDIFDNVIVNFGFDQRSDRASGAFATNDYYTRPVDRGLVRNPDNRLINSHPGRRVISPNLNTPTGNAALAGALWDPYGYWGPAGNYWVYDIPFLTAGRSCAPVNGSVNNGMSCAGPYYGVSGFRIDGSDPFKPLMPLTVTRLDSNQQPIDQWIVENGNGGSRNTFGIMSWMRHFAAVPGGRYLVEFRDSTTSVALPVSELKVMLSNMHTTADQVILGLPFGGSAPVLAYLTTRENYDDAQPGAPHRRDLTQVSSFTALLTTDNSFWHDIANQRVWVNARGGVPFTGSAPNDPLSDEALYRDTYLRLYRP
ncbi:G8 domain-containing protein [Chloroflexus sp.]|uniref:G8 domain-containing protein n=1 Tax=Chloroflexus sp. TaxID=1904827 RepID=UPI00260D5F79|nr:G8 domain-containing protein [uncultured Chloroflexus sp.]